MPETLVLLPGLQSDHTSWTYQIEHLKDHYDILVPKGHHSKTSIAEMADCVLDQLPSRFHFAAWSMGGYVAMHMLPQIRQRLISLVLISTSARPEDPANTKRRLDNLATAESMGMAAANERSLAFSCLDVDQLDPKQREALKQSAYNLGVNAYRAQQHAIIKRPDGRANLALICCPTLVIVGEGDKVTPPVRAQEIHAAIDGSEFSLIKDCGHCPPLEKPDQINHLLGDWMSRHGTNTNLVDGQKMRN